MKYRILGNTGANVSVLGFGAMRLPVIDNDPQRIDAEKTEKMLNIACAAGVNYFDTAYAYHGGNSEVFLGNYFHKNNLRSKIFLATKLPAWLIERTEDFEKYFREQQQKLQTEYFDFYLLHALNRKVWPKIRDLQVLNWLEEKINKGFIRFIGFSFHDDLEVFKSIIDYYDKWDFCQIQYNYMDIGYQAGMKGLVYATSRGIPVIIMEPLRGGQLSKEPPQPVLKIWNECGWGKEYADRALQWLWNQKKISLVLSGMSNPEQVEQNIRSAASSAVDRLSPRELSCYDKIRRAYLKLSPIPCTNCKYCLPCPQGVYIPYIFEIYNMARMYDDLSRARIFYNWIRKEGGIDLCIQCGECEEKCPQKIQIRSWLQEASRVLTDKES